MGEESEVETLCVDSKESSGQDTVCKLLLRRGSLSWAHHGRLHWKATLEGCMEGFSHFCIFLV